MKALLRTIAAALLVALATGGALLPPAWAKDAAEVGDDPANERHMMALAAELRCLQCQNQTLADSNAPLAVDLRQEIRELLAKGQSDQQVKDYLVARYGDFVLYRPPVKTNTLLLWFGPGLLLAGGLLALYLALKRRLARLDAMERAAQQESGGGAQLSAADSQRARTLLEEENGEGSLS